MTSDAYQCAATNAQHLNIRSSISHIGLRVLHNALTRMIASLRVVFEGTCDRRPRVERKRLVSYLQHVAERTVFPSVASSILMTAPTVIIF
ncbi:hypothetical protein ANTRET_LOCUS6846 [Anthophora retusa]